MTTLDPHGELKARVNARLRDRKTKAQHCTEQKLYERLQQMSLLCRLFQKQVKIQFKDAAGQEPITTSVYLATPRTIILQDGRFVPLREISDVTIC